MTDEEPTRQERIAAAEADQERRHAEGGTVQERIDRLRALSAEITGAAPPAPAE